MAQLKPREKVLEIQAEASHAWSHAPGSLKRSAREVYDSMLHPTLEGRLRDVFDSIRLFSRQPLPFVDLSLHESKPSEPKLSESKEAPRRCVEVLSESW